MRIIVIGCGKIGHDLIGALVNEGHEIIVIDKNLSVIEEIVSIYDVMGIQGHGANYEIQIEAGVAKSDLTIAVTSSDELNIVCCMMAKKIGTHHTIARIRDIEYFNYLTFMKEQLGLSLVLNPEAETAKEISRILRYPTATKVETFAKGRIDLVEIKLGTDNPLIGIALSELYHNYKTKILICTVKRNKDIYIPDGNFILKEHDSIYITASREQLQLFFSAIHLQRKKTKNVMIIGGGITTYYLSRELKTNHIQIKIIENNLETCQLLSDLLPFTTIIYGDGTNHELLEEEGIANMDACVTITGVDEINVMSSLYATSKQIPKVITKISRHHLEPLLDSIGVDCAVSSNQVSVNHIIQYVRAKENSRKRGNHISTLYLLVKDKVEAIEFSINKSTNYLNIPLKNLKLKTNLLIAGIVRNNKLIIPDGESFMKLNDKVIVVTTNKYLKDLEDILG
jgi:K+ transport systems, NAD-binding component